MNCQNCGAATKPILNQDYFHCEYCGTYNFPYESPDGVKVLEDVNQERFCPVCKLPLLHAKIDKYPALHCKKCQGTLTSQLYFGKAIQLKRARAKGPPDEPIPLNPQDFKRRIICPVCGCLMSTHPYSGPGNIMIDTCIHCEIIWLDYGEIGRVINAPGRDRSRPIEE